MNKFKVSLISVIFNPEDSFQDTVASIAKAKIDDEKNQIEYIVVDGGSSDIEQHSFHKYGDCIDQFVSENDSGIYDAMNKAISLASSDWVIFINEGDRLVDIEPILDFVNSECSDRFLAASFCVNMDDKIYFRPKFDFRTKIFNTLHHQGTVYRKCDSFKYDLNYKVFSDFDYNQKMLKSDCRVHLSNQLVAFHSLDGVSSQKSSDTRKELFSIIRKNYGLGYVLLSFFYFKFRGLFCKIRKYWL